MKELISVNCSILLVDDEEEIVEFTRDELKSSFEKVIIAKDGLEAIEILKVQKIDLMVTDYKMPLMNGLELINYTKQHYPLIPIIMLTGNSTNKEVIQALNNGAFDILGKPFRTQVLINRIQNGLLVPVLTKILWSILSKDLNLLKLEDFLTKPLNEQYQIINKYSSHIQMPSNPKQEEL